MQKLNELSAREAARRLAARDITAEQLARACLERIEARESTVGAWIHLDPDARPGWVCWQLFPEWRS